MDVERSDVSPRCNAGKVKDAERSEVAVMSSNGSEGGLYTSDSGVSLPVILRSSSSGFAWGELIHSKYKSSCLRWILLQSHRPFEIAKKYSELGKQNEDYHEEALKKEGLTFIREMLVEQPTPVTGVLNRGHIDFLVRDKDGLVVHELKHIQSKNVCRDVIKNGHYIIDNLAQCVNYMLQAKTQRGVLKYTFYEGLSPLREREFKIAIDDFGRIAVNGIATQFHVSDQLAHQRQASLALKNQKVMQRPQNGDALFTGACHWCPVRDACDRYDQGAIEGTKAFIESCEKLLDEKEDENE